MTSGRYWEVKTMAIPKAYTGGWSYFIMMFVIVASIVLIIFTTVIQAALMGIALVLIFAFMLYYAGVRVDERLRHGKQTQVVKHEAPMGGHGGGQRSGEGGQTASNDTAEVGGDEH